MARRLKIPDLKDPISRTRFLLYLGALVILVLFIVAIGIPVASNPKFCGSLCHQKADYNSLQYSAHAKITCYACHVDRGVVNLLKEKTTLGLAGAYGAITGNYEKPRNAESELSQEHMTRETCFRCHDITTRKFTPSDGLTFTSGPQGMHQKHLEAELECTTCHNRVAHKLKGSEIDPVTGKKTDKFEYEKGEEEHHRYKDFMDMKEGCLRCHTEGAKKRDEIKEKYGKLAPTACTTCHPLDWKKLPVGHGPDWRGIHGPIARRDFKYCFDCHQAVAKFNYEGKAFCLKCHDENKVKSFETQVF